MYIIPTILISFWSNKIGVYNMRQIKKFTWLQACFLGNVRVLWCNSLGDTLFQIYVMNFVEIVIDFYLHITSHVAQVFASCTHYISYSLLNFVHEIVCKLVWPSKIIHFVMFDAKFFQGWFNFWEEKYKTLFLKT